MVLSEIRESIEIQTVDLDGQNIGIVQKKINLKPMMLHRIVQMDIFQDAIIQTDSPTGVIIEWFVSPYPIIYSEMPLSIIYGKRGPVAANDTVLMKAIAIADRSPEAFGSIKVFPNQFLGATPTFSFYTPTLYITGIVHAEPGSLVGNLAYSFYIASDDKKANPTSYGLGMIRERSVAQGMNLVQQGRTIPQASNVGQIFPSWKFGGIRPERMLSGTTARNFWLNYSADQSEAMLNTATLRSYVKGARTMASFDEAFGVDDAVLGNIPDWLRFGLNRGLQSGPIRAQQPPRKLADNGNTLMF